MEMISALLSCVLLVKPVDLVSLLFYWHTQKKKKLCKTPVADQFFSDVTFILVNLLYIAACVTLSLVDVAEAHLPNLDLEILITPFFDSLFTIFRVDITWKTDIEFFVYAQLGLWCAYPAVRCEMTPPPQSFVS